MKEDKNRLPLEVWLDYVENETEKSLKEDLARVLEHRPEYRKTVKEIVELKKHLKDTATQLPGEENFKKMKSNIMAVVEKTTPEKKISPWQRHNKAMTYTTMALAAVVTGGILTQTTIKNGKTKKMNPVIEDQLVASNIIDVHSLTDISEDLLLDAAAEKLSELPENIVQAELDKLSK